MDARRVAKMLVNAAAAAAVTLILAYAPFTLTRPGSARVECRASEIWSPPKYGSGPFLCSVNLEQLVIRLAIILGAWYAARRVVASLSDKSP
jgi:hypothetical protein